MTTGIKQSIFDQTGNFSFSFNVAISDLTKHVNVGFTGTSNINFQFYQGKIYDQQNEYCGSYLSNQQVFISGDAGYNSYDYFVNNTATAIQRNKSTGIINYFYVNSESGNNVNFNSSINGRLPNFTLTNPINFLQGSISTGAFLNNESLCSFRIFSGSGDNNQILWSGNSTGNIAPNNSGIFYNYVSGANAGIAYSGNYTFYTNFGTFIAPILFNCLSTGLEFTTFTLNSQNFGFISGVPTATGYDLGGITYVTQSGNQFINTSFLDVRLIYSSGATGNVSENIPLTGIGQVLTSGVIFGSGNLSGLATGIGTGNSTITPFSYTGLVSGELSIFSYYTGNAGKTYTGLASGIATGLVNGSGYTGFATGYITETITGYISNGSGVLSLFNNPFTGIGSGIQFTGVTGSGLVGNFPFSGGNITDTITGSGLNSQYITGYCTGIINQFLYQKSFTDAWNLYTGINQNNLINFKQNNWDNVTGFYNPAGRLNNLTGNSFYIRIDHIPYYDYGIDVANLLITGLNTGILIPISGQRV